MRSQLERAGRLCASMCLLLSMLFPASGEAQQPPPTPQPDAGAKEFQAIVQDLFKGMDTGGAGATNQAPGQGSEDPAGQVFQQLLQGLGQGAGGQGEPPGDGHPFGGLLEGLAGKLNPSASGGGRDEECKNLVALSSMRDMLEPVGTPAAREKYEKFTNLHLAAVQALLRRDWEEHIRAAHEALAIEKEIEEWPSVQPRWLLMGTHWTNLSTAYFSRQQGNRAENTESGIHAGLKSLEYMPKEGVCAELRTMAQVNLAAGYVHRIRGEKAENLELAIAALQAGLEPISPEAFPQMWANVQLNLGVAYINRIRGRRRENQDRAIEAYHAALRSWDRQTHPQLWATVQSNLGSAYARRVSGDRAENIELAIAALEDAVKLRKPEAEEKVAPTPAIAKVDEQPTDETAAMLLSALRNVHELLTLASQSEAGAVQMMDSAGWAIAYQNLAVAYHRRIRGDRADNIERAIDAHNMALTFLKPDLHADKWATVHTNLGESLMLRVEGDRAANIERAIESYRLALSVRAPESFPRGHLNTATALGQALNAKGDWAGALQSFDGARGSFRLLFGQGLNEAEARSLLEEAGPLFTDAAYAAAARGDVERAFDLLEEGKARLLAVALKLDRLGASAAERKRLDDLRRQIREAEAVYDAAQGEDKAARIAHLGGLRADLLKLVDAAEAKTTAARASDPVSLARLLPRNGALVAPIVSDAGAKAILVTQGDGRAKIEAIDLPGLDREILNRFLGARDQGGWLGAYSQQDKGRLGEWFTAIKEGGDELGRLFSAPIVDALKARGLQPGTNAQLVILPVGPLGLLPLGLARHPATGRHLVEDYTVSFAPSISALLTAQARAGQKQGEPSLAVVANPTEDLAFTEAEGALIATRFAPAAARVLVRKQATPEAVLAALKGRDYWHFSSHGRFEWDDPRASGLFLAMQKPLTVGALMDAEGIGAPRLTVLSACETGLYDIATTPNEFIGLPAAFMRLGAGGVLATLWPVADLSTALLVARFYDLHRRENLPPAAALRGAQSWLRGATYADLVGYSRRAVEEGRLPQAFLQQIEAQLRSLKAQQATDMPFAHPYYWGGFTLTGL